MCMQFYIHTSIIYFVNLMYVSHQYIHIIHDITYVYTNILCSKPCIKVSKKMENDASNFVLLQIKSYSINIAILYEHKYHFEFIRYIINKVLKLNENIKINFHAFLF